jgi:hypothetical protein
MIENAADILARRRGGLSCQADRRCQPCSQGASADRLTAKAMTQPLRSCGWADRRGDANRWGRVNGAARPIPLLADAAREPPFRPQSRFKSRWCVLIAGSSAGGPGRPNRALPTAGSMRGLRLVMPVQHHVVSVDGRLKSVLASAWSHTPQWSP